MHRARPGYGGDWTTEKLERVRKYLVAYATIMNRQNFRFSYIDAFAGTGYRENPPDNPAAPFFPELAEPESRRFIDGSPRVALQVQPRFNNYIFIERDVKRYAELEELKDGFPDLRDDIQLENTDASSYIMNLCRKSWGGRRAVLFLDPFGMQVTWDTIEAIAGTKAIDLWLLFPLGVAINRLMKRDGKINDTWHRKLDMMFGATDWYEAFYRPRITPGLFGDEASMEKIANFESMGEYFVKRLKTVFAGVAENPLPLMNSRNNPLYLLCFAAGNPKGAPTAIKIARDILRR